VNTNDDCILLLSKQFSGEISPDESVLLDEWLRQSPDHERLAAEIQQVWERTGTYQKTFSPDLTADFQNIEARIRNAEPVVTSNPLFTVRLGRLLLRAAAVLIVMVASVWGWRNLSTTPVALLTATVTNAEKQRVELPDGSMVWLRRNATLEYPKQFQNAERRVKLTAGEAYFEVAHNAAQPFVVETPDGDLVRVLGTAFGVGLAPGRITVAVRSGRVQFSPQSKREGVVLTARQKATFDLNNPQIVVSQNITLNELAWQTGGLEFVRTPLSQVTTDLEQYYKVKITLRNPALQNCLHTAPLTNQSIRKVLESLALTYGMQVVEVVPDQFDLLGGTCE